MPPARFDLIIVGGGLAGGLAVLALKQVRPDLDLVLVEPGPIGGHHLWSFFDSDIAAADMPLVAPLVRHRWPAYDVRFPALRRRLGHAYQTIPSEALDAAVRAVLPADRIIVGRAVEVSHHSATVENGALLWGRTLLDTRGIGVSRTGAEPSPMVCGWQKFVGQTLTVPVGHGVERPIIMDATVDQSDGYRFVYSLPLSPTDLFVEDTYYSTDPHLDRAAVAERISAYAAAQGWVVSATGRQESGVLPVVMGGYFDHYWPATDRVARGGVRAGLFHHLTSYSLPDAVRFAAWLAREAPLDARLGVASREFAQAHWRHARFDRLLARLLLRAADPPVRYRILERFYRLPEPLIGRFYAGRATMLDRLRILAGKPPVPIGRAVSAMLDRG